MELFQVFFDQQRELLKLRNKILYCHYNCCLHCKPVYLLFFFITIIIIIIFKTKILFASQFQAKPHASLYFSHWALSLMQAALAKRPPPSLAGRSKYDMNSDF